MVNEGVPASATTQRGSDQITALVESTPITSWDLLKRRLNKLGPSWIFRGQADASWTLQTTLERSIAGIGTFSMRQWEQVLIERFQRAAHQHVAPGGTPELDDTFQWLALMQHYGAPTRLLDWTRSPYVAMYFALEEAKSVSTIWALDSNWLHSSARGFMHLREVFAQARKTGESVSTRIPDDDVWPTRQDYWTKEQVNKIVLAGDIECLAALEPFRLHERLAIQQGLFLIPMDLRLSISRLLVAYAGPELDKHLKKFNLDPAIRGEALTDLNRMNVNRSTLFPGLDGYASSLKLYPTIHSEEYWMAILLK